MAKAYKPTVLRKCEVCGGEFYGMKFEHYHKKHPEFKISKKLYKHKNSMTTKVKCEMQGCTWEGAWKFLLTHFRRCHSGQIKPAIVQLAPVAKTTDVLYIADLIAQLNEKIKAGEKRNKEQEVVMNKLMEENVCLRAKLSNKEQEAARLDAKLMQAQETLLRRD
jgi:hypothetical protein